MDMFDEDPMHSGISDHIARKLVRFPPSHHSAPLTYFPQRHIVGLIAGREDIPIIPFFERVILAVRTLTIKWGGQWSITEDPAPIVHYVLSKMREPIMVFTSSVEIARELADSIYLASSEMLKDVEAIGCQQPVWNGIDVMHSFNYQQVLEVAQILAFAYRLRKGLINLRSIIQQRHVNQTPDDLTCYKVHDLRIYLSGDMLLVVLSSENNIIHLMNYDQLLMLIDTANSRYVTMLTCCLNDAFFYDNLPPAKLLRTVYEWGDDLIKSFGMSAYQVIGEFESIVTGVFVTFKDTDPLDLGSDFLASILATAEETYASSSIPTERTTSLLNILQRITSLNHLSELFGVRKHWGNPMVEAALSGRSVLDKLAEDLPVSGVSVMHNLASFNRMITVNFIEKVGKWPECYFMGTDENCPIRTARDKNIIRLPEGDPHHEHLHWALLRFLPNCLIDSYKDDLSLISDKSISVYQDNLDSIYVRAMQPHSLRKQPTESRRLILEYLRESHPSIHDIFKTIMCDSAPERWFANSASMKGTEMKADKARIFAVLTYELRQYFAATEDLIKNHIFPYIPYQTMTMSETELMSKLKEVTSQMDPVGASSLLSVMHIVDFSKWNLRMKHENTCLIFQSMDDFLGTPGLIANSHQIFSSMVNVVQDAFNPPRNGVLRTEGDTVWRFHHGGWEGQRQKGWTALTSALLSNLERLTGVKSMICGQGDNQILLSQFPVPSNFKNASDWVKNKTRDVKVILDSFYKKLETECEMVGLKIKTAETCRSLSYFNYGKRLFFNGVELSMTLKRLSRMVNEPNDSYPTTEFNLKTQEGAAFASGLFSHPSLLPYLVSRIELIDAIDSSFKNNQLIGAMGAKCVREERLVFQRFLKVLLKIPSSLGGVPQLSLSSYLFRGHPDPLCTDFVMLTFRAKNGCVTSRSLLRIIENESWFDTGISGRESLIMAPYSLNMRLPLSSRKPLDREILPAVRSFCRNPTVREMFSTEFSILSSDLLEILSTMTPFQPIVANDIFSRSIPGRLKSFLSGLTNTTSLGRLIYESSVSPLLMRVSRLESDQLTGWVKLVKYVIENPVYDLAIKEHHVIAQTARCRSWDCDIVGVTVPHPLEQFICARVPSDLCGEVCMAHCLEHLVIVRHSEQMMALPGGDSNHVTCMRSKVGNPYTGSSVREGVIQREVTCLNPDSTWRDIIRLNTVRKWVTQPGSLFSELIQKLINTRTDVSMTIVDGATGLPSRLSYSHRAHLMKVVQSCSTCSTHNMLTRLYISSNRMGEYSHGEFNYHMPYGPAFLCIQQLIILAGVSQLHVWGSDNRDVFHAHVRNSNIPIVYDGYLGINKSMFLQLCTFDKVAPPLLYSCLNDLKFEFPTMDIRHIVDHDVSIMELSQKKCGYANQLLGDILVREMVVRELFNITDMSGYDHRGTPISVGDVTLVGVKRFFQVLALALLLVAPQTVLTWKHECSAHVGTCLYLERFSIGFWSYISTPFCNYRLLAKLNGLYPSFVCLQMSTSQRGVITIIKQIVCYEVVQYMKHIRNHMSRYTYRSPVDLFVPSASAATLMLMRFIDMTVSVCMSACDSSIIVVKSISTDLLKPLFGSGDFQLKNFYLQCKMEFVKLQVKNGVRMPVHLPDIDIFQLNYPWVDDIRDQKDIDFTPQMGLSKNGVVLKADNLDKIKRNKLEIRLYGSEVRIPVYDCACIPIPQLICRGEETFFLKTGSLGKEHYHVLDLIRHHQVVVDTVLVLESRSGTEAAALSLLHDCNRVYNLCFISMSEWTPHMAGTYLAPAFATAGNSEKLIQPDRGVLPYLGLKNETSVIVVCEQIRKAPPGGIYVDLACQEYNNFDERASTHNLTRICEMYPDLKWVLIKIRVHCKHRLVSVISVLATCFAHVTVHRSMFSSASSREVYIMFQDYTVQPDLIRRANIPDLIVLFSNNDIQQFYLKVVELRFKSLYNYPKKLLKYITDDLAIMDDSLVHACGQFMPGWVPISPEMFTRDLISMELVEIMAVLRNELSETVRTLLRASQIQKDSRVKVLQTLTSSPTVHLNVVFSRLHRCDLLHKILHEDKISPPDVFKKIEVHFSSIYRTELVHGVYEFHPKLTSFYKRYSKHMFEILGRLYGNNYVCVPMVVKPTAIHRKFPDIEMVENTDKFPFLSLELQSVANISDLRWSWGRRSEIMFLLLLSVLVETNICVHIPHAYLINDLHERGCIHNIIKHDENCVLPISGVIVTQTDELRDFIPHLAERVWLVVLVEGLTEVRQHFEIIKYHKLPWSGISPSSVLVECKLQDHNSYANHGEEKYPSFDSLLGFDNKLGTALAGCSCYDCTLECALLDCHNLSSAYADKLCSPFLLESVLDISHD